MATTIDLPSPEVDILSTDLFPGGRSLTFEGQILQAQNIAIMTTLQDIRRTLHQGSGTVPADKTTKLLVAPRSAPTRTPRATPRVSKAPGTVLADETIKSLVAPTRKWLAEGSKKASSDNPRKLYKLMNTDGARVIARKCKMTERAAKAEGEGTHEDGKKGQGAKRGSKKATNDSTRKRATPEDQHSDTSHSCARQPKASKHSHDAEDEDQEPVVVARKARRSYTISDDDIDEEDDEGAEAS
ncbi:hypothetical protein KC347_g8108 [Hortaea werneckii]|nr:hypothetical protein KC347_g8108 [Hortaea werneckii]